MLDNFTAADGTALAAHDNKWTSGPYSWGVDGFEINNNLAEQAGGWQGGDAFYSDGQSEDHSSQIKIVGISDTSGSADRRRAVCRMTGANSGYAVELGGTGTHWTSISIIKDGAWAGGGSGSWLKSADHTLKLEVTGNASAYIEAWVDDVSSKTMTDATSPITGGYPGIYIESVSAAAVELTRIDDWTDGIATLGGAPHNYYRQAALRRSF